MYASLTPEIKQLLKEYKVTGRYDPYKEFLRRYFKKKRESITDSPRCFADARDLFADVVFQVRGEEIPAHRAILAARSSYLGELLLTGKWKHREVTPNLQSSLITTAESHLEAPAVKCYNFQLGSQVFVHWEARDSSRQGARVYSIVQTVQTLG